MNRRRVFNICLSVLITVAFALLAVFVFSDSYLRFGEAVKDFGLSVGYYFCTLFGIEHNIVPSVTEYSSVMDWGILLPSDLEGFTSQATSFFSLLVDGENFSGYWAKVGDVMLVLLKVVAIMLPCLLVLGLIIWRLYKSGNTKHNKDTVPLKVFKSFSRCLYQPLKRTVLSYRDFLAEHRAVWILWAVMWAFHLNAASIVTGFLAYYFYFVLSFDVANLYVQVCKLFIDLQVIFGFFPWWIIALVCWLLFDRWRKNIAQNRLRHFEARNCGFINELPIVSGQEKDNPHHGHGTVTRGDVQTKGTLHITAERHEVSVLSMDSIRGRTTAVYGARHGV